jgi:hypothetical protein
MRTLRLVATVVVVAAALAGCSGRPVAALKVGECFDFDRDGTEVSTVSVVECSTPHVAEVFAVFDLDLDAYDPDAIATSADDQCLAAFEPYAGIPYAAAKYYYRTMTPSESSWEQGARSVVCFVYPTEGTLDSSIKAPDA